ncbi:T9SS type A sorting domain-containing protein [Flavobacterium sp. SM15]|uniref:T9SS type A sorting domain-containing protein n=1 Tax=Flavobacterium sp. SM15 TaxID=2908005 RepID=UPI001EDA5BE5|nr:T9SS type A sorting domain-containing protein [Flavobacterium sp. SM15]MCG2611374.1 T9SS type A sorting domain-containing protein [Flavobacterium sp. SM15]
MMNYYNSLRSLGNQISGSLHQRRTEKRFKGVVRFFNAAVMLLAVLFVQGSFGQSTANYAFTTNATSSLALDANGNTVDMSSGTTQLVGAGLDAAASVVTNIGFNFVFMGTGFTQFSVNEDGQLKLGSVVVGTNSYGITGGTAAAPLLTALNADFRTGTTTGKIHYKLVGTAPNRTLVVEFKDMQIFYTGTAAAGNSTWQMRLYETSGSVEYVYGTVNATDISTGNRTPTIGFYTGGTSNLFASVLYASQTVSTTTPYTVNPIVSALGDFTGLSSASNGSRRAYKFTPSTPAAGPTGLLLSAVTPSGMTLNWTAASPTTNIVRYVVYSSTNGGATYNFVANVALGTNTYVATGLTPSTTYDWKVVAVSEGVESTGATATQATTAAATYYWVGATGGSWNTAANWNTAADNTGATRSVVANTDILVVDGDGTTPGGTTTINVDLASFTIGQLIVNSNTNLTLQSNIATTRTITISGALGDDFVVAAGSTLNLTNAANAVAFAFSGTGNVGLIAGTLNIGGASGNTFNSTGGTATLVTVTATGIINNTFAGSSGVTGSVATLSFLDGSAYNVSGATTGAPNIPLATWATNATLTVSGLTTSTTAPTNNNQSFGNLVFNCPGLTGSYPFFTTVTTGIVKGNLSVTTGSGQFRTVSSGTLNILGNVNVLAGRYQPFSGTGTVIVGGNTVIAAGSTFDVSLSAGLYVQRGATFTNNGTIAGPNSATASTLYFFPVTAMPQTWGGTGTVNPALNTVSLNNTSGLTISQPGPITLLRANLFTGNIVGSDRLTFGTGAALAATIQVGSTGSTDPGGVLVSAPTWNLGTGAFNLLYAQSAAYTTTNEIPPSRTATNVTLNNTNGVTLAGGSLEVSGTLTLTAGNFTTSTANLLSLGTASAAGTLAGGSATSYINGPFARTIASGNANSNYILYPVGKTAFNPVSLAPATTAVSIMKAEAFDTNTGTTDASILSLSSKRWEAPLMSGTITNINVRLGDSGIGATNIPVQAPSAAGVYSAILGSTATFAAGTPNTTTTNTATAGAGYTGYLAYAVSNACSGTPSPGNTVSSATTICLGGSVNLSLQNTTTGSGVTYQWQSSTDGVTYSNIALATNSTYTATPSDVTYYQCVVTCTTGPASTTSTPVQITFTNTVLSTTPGTRCGTGTVNLAATGSGGTTVKWYALANGGTALGTGTSFVTPSISGNTTYYAAAESYSAGISSLGNGLTNSNTAGESIFPGAWGGAKTQYIIKASELIAAGFSAGNLTSLGFEPTNSGQTYQGFNVSIGHTANVTAPTTTFISTGLTQVYAGPGANDSFVPVAGSLNTLVFGTGTGSSSSFTWDGTSNIVVSIAWSSVPSATTSTSTTMKVDNVGFVSSAYRQRDSFTPAQMLAETSVSSTTSVRPRFTINGQIICSSPRVAVAATVTTPPALTLSASSVSICNGASSSAVTLTAGGADYDTYVWSPATNVTGDSVSGWVFNPGSTTTYTLTASQSSGSLCTTSATVNVTVNPLPSVLTISPASASVCEGVVQTLTATVPSGSTTIGSDTTVTTQNGIEPTAFNNRYEHYWMQMVFTAAELNAAGVQAGNINGIKFNITTIGSATSVSDYRVYMGNTALSTLTGYVTTGLSEVFAAATYTQQLGVNTITFNTPYAWDGISNIILDVRSTGADSTNNSSTYYTATADNKTVTSVTSTTFPSSNAYVASNPAGTLSLKRLNTTFDWSSVTPNSITWSPTTDLYTDASGTVPYTGTNANTVYFKSSTVGVASYNVTATSAAACTRTTPVSVTVNGNRAIALSSSVGTDAQVLCNGNSISAITYALSNATSASVSGLPTGVTGSYLAGTFTISGTPSVLGTFNYTVTPVGCGSAIATGTITINQTAAATASTTVQPTCSVPTGTIVVSAPTGATLEYSVDGVTYQSSTTFSGLTPNTYSVTVRDTATGCVSSATSVTVNAIPAAPTAPTASVTSQPTCSVPTGTIVVSAPVGATLEYSVDGVTYQSSTAFTGLTPNTYSVTVRDTATGCVSSATSVTVNAIPAAPAAPTASTTVQPTCLVSTGTIEVSAPVGATLEYSIDGATYQASTTFAGLVPGSYSVTVRDTATGCVSSAASVTVNAIPAAPVVPSASVTVQPTCSVPTGTIQVSSPVGATLEYSIDGATYQASTTFAGLVPGSYSVTVRDTATGCVSSAASVTVNAIPAAPTAPSSSVTQPTCSVSTGTIQVSTPVGASLEYSIDGVTYQASTTFAGLTSGTYSVTVRDTATGCISSATSETINAAPTAPSAPTGAATQVISVADPADATIEDLVATGSNIIWYNSDADALAGINPIAAGTQLVDGAIYYATQTVGGCTSTSTLAVTVTVTLGMNDFAMNSFKFYPNPVTDVLNIEYSLNISNVEVYNALGQQVAVKSVNQTRTSLDMSGLAGGTYLVKVTLENAVKTIKVIKK